MSALPGASMTMSQIERMLYERIGLDPSTVGSSLVERAVQRRMTSCRLRDLGAYSARLAVDAQEILELVEEVVIPETYFFRELEGLEAVAQRAVGATADSPLRVLSAPCSTGEEPYSIAMTLLAAGVPADAIAIDAVDVSREAVVRARAAVYRGGSFRGTDDHWRRFFHAVPAGHAVNGDVRALVRIEQANLLDTGFRAPRAAYDVIFCRNLLIYFDLLTQERVLGVLTSLLVPDGTLVVGAADTFAVRRAGFVPIPGSERAFLFQHRAEAPQGIVAAPRTRGAPRPARSRGARSLPAAQVKRRVAPAAVSALPASDSAPAPTVIAEIARLAGAGQLVEALQRGEAALATAGADAELLAMVGTMHAAMNDHVRAESCYRRALYLDPAHADALVHLALLLDQRGDAAEARRLRTRARRQLAGDVGGAP